MTWPTLTQISVLLAAGGIAVWVAVIAFSRKQVPGGRTFAWLNLAIAHWCFAGAFHAFDQTLESRVLWAKIQYIGIASVPPLWLLFAADYARSPWAGVRRWRRALWIIPAAATVAVWTNDSHHLYWTRVVETNGSASYERGPLFWAYVAYNYLLVGAGTFALLRAIRLFSQAFRSQTAALLIATMWPWVGNALYLTGVFRPGFDPTPLMFVVSLVLFVWGLYAHQLFDVVPIARGVVFERLGDAVFVLDRSYRVIDANAAAVKLVAGSRKHVTLHEVVGLHPSELLPWWRDLPSPPVTTSAAPVLVEDEKRILELTGESFVDQRGYSGSLLWVRDVTGRRNAEIEHAALERKVQEQRRIESLTVLAAGLAHDFNNLLTAMLGNADYLATTLPVGDQQDSAQAIATAAQHAADLVAHMVAFSGQGKGFVAPVAIEEAVGDVIRAMSRTLGERALVTHESDPDLPQLSGDVVQIRQAVIALLTNAVDAVAALHGHVEVLTGRETLDAAALEAATYSAGTPGDFLYIEVRDEGPGMPPEVLARVFEPFFSTRDLGRGLGLAAVHGIVRQHEGAIRIWSAPGKGTRVRVWFPLS